LFLCEGRPGWPPLAHPTRQRHAWQPETTLGDGRSESGLSAFCCDRQAGLPSRSPPASATIGRPRTALGDGRNESGLSAFCCDRQAAFTALTSFVSESFASPKNITVFGSNMSSLSMPANPGRIDRFMKMMFLAWSALRIGIP